MKSKKIDFSDIPELSASHERPTTQRLERFERLGRLEPVMRKLFSVVDTDEDDGVGDQPTVDH